MPEVKEQGPGTAGLVTPIRVDGVFDDPGVIRRLVQRHGPYRTMASYLPDAAVRGRRAADSEGMLPHFRAIWAAGGRQLVDGPRSSFTTPACCLPPRSCLTLK
jgi:hypothetical protein